MTSRRPDDESAGLPPEWAGFVVPDDISELEPEIRAVRGELPMAEERSRRARLGRIFETPRWQRSGLSGPLVAVVLLAVLAFASLVFLLRPATPPSPTPRPLAKPTVAPGVAEALLPDLAVPVGRTGSVRLRNLRPAVIVLVPAKCDCTPLIADVITSTTASRLNVLVLGERQDPPLPRTAPQDRVRAGTDTGGQLAMTYQAGPAPMVLFVRSDGTVARVMHNAEPGAQLHQEIRGLAG